MEYMRKPRRTKKLFLTVNEVAKRLGLSRDSVLKMLGHSLPKYRFGRCIRVRLDAVEHYQRTHCEK